MVRSTDQRQTITIVALHRPPSVNESSLLDLACSMQCIRNKHTKHMVLGGYFSLPHINWKKKSIEAGSNHHMQHQQIHDMAQEFGLERMQLSPSRESNVLDLYFATYPSLVKSCYTVPGISDHHMLVVDCDVKPRYNKHRKLYIYKKANWTNIKSNLRALGMCITHFPSSVETK